MPGHEPYYYCNIKGYDPTKKQQWKHKATHLQRHGMTKLAPEERRTCLYTYNHNDVSAFLFHEACFEILAKSLGHADPSLVGNDVLYAVMRQSVEDYNRVLDLGNGLNFAE